MPSHPKLKAAIYLALCATSLAVLSVPAHAGESDEAPGRVVKFADLDLTRSAGVAALYARLQSAARQVCEPAGTRDLKAEALARTCVAHAVERAINDINVPQLASYYQEKTGRKPTISLAKLD
ncbi:MAG TPA: UrcA family protein [Steroidobacteraceae bacterium]|jgi:UrcA family protein|nr:UrcA family protein [Steroidobacteraceae bacterium]